MDLLHVIPVSLVVTFIVGIFRSGQVCHHGISDIELQTLLASLIDNRDEPFDQHPRNTHSVLHITGGMLLRNKKRIKVPEARFDEPETTLATARRSQNQYI